MNKEKTLDIQKFLAKKPSTMVRRPINLTAIWEEVKDSRVAHPYKYPRPKTRVQEDLAMSRAKGRPGDDFFSPEMQNSALEPAGIERELRTALKRGELALFYQPIIRAEEGRVTGMEALVRWHHPTIGMIPPDRFIPIAEDTGLIIPMGDWIISEACQGLKELETVFGPDLIMGINISVHQLLKPDFAWKLTRQVAQAQVPPSRIKLEFTESMRLNNTQAVLEKLNELKKLGFILAVDDFGTGYSSLSYLQQFPIDQLKIDRSFIESIGTNKNTRAIVSFILSLSQNLGLTTVAEGVENREQLDILVSLGCKYVQGYLFSKPLPAEILMKNYGQ